MKNDDWRRIRRLAKIRECNAVLKSLNMRIVLCVPGPTDQVMAKIGDKMHGVNLATTGETVGNIPKTLGLSSQRDSIMVGQLIRWIRGYRRHPVSVWAEWLGPNHQSVTTLNSAGYGDASDTACIRCGSVPDGGWLSYGTAKNSGPACKSCVEKPKARTQERAVASSQNSPVVPWQQAESSHAIVAARPQVSKETFTERSFSSVFVVRQRGNTTQDSVAVAGRQATNSARCHSDRSRQHR